VDGIGTRTGERDEGVPELVIGDALALLLREDARAPLEPDRDAVDALLQLIHPDRVLAAPGGEEGRLVHDVRELGARETGGARGEDVEVCVGPEPDTTCVEREDRRPAASVGEVDDDLAVGVGGSRNAR